MADQENVTPSADEKPSKLDLFKKNLPLTDPPLVVHAEVAVYIDGIEFEDDEELIHVASIAGRMAIREGRSFVTVNDLVRGLEEEDAYDIDQESGGGDMVISSPLPSLATGKQEGEAPAEEPAAAAATETLNQTVDKGEGGEVEDQAAPARSRSRKSAAPAVDSAPTPEPGTGSMDGRVDR